MAAKVKMDAAGTSVKVAPKAQIKKMPSGAAVSGGLGAAALGAMLNSVKKEKPLSLEAVVKTLNTSGILVYPSDEKTLVFALYHPRNSFGETCSRIVLVDEGSEVKVELMNASNEFFSLQGKTGEEHFSKFSLLPSKMESDLTYQNLKKLFEKKHACYSLTQPQKAAAAASNDDAKHSESTLDGVIETFLKAHGSLKVGKSFTSASSPVRQYADSDGLNCYQIDLVDTSQNNFHLTLKAPFSDASQADFSILDSQFAVIEQGSFPLSKVASDGYVRVLSIFNGSCKVYKINQ